MQIGDGHTKIASHQIAALALYGMAATVVNSALRLVNLKVCQNQIGLLLMVSLKSVVVLTFNLSPREHTA